MGRLAMPSLIAQAATPSLGGLLLEHAGADATLWVLAVGAIIALVASLPLLAFRARA
jgi:predicted MFS family arabinose efflux permease